MNKTNTPYELRAELLNRAIDVVQMQYNIAFQVATSNFAVVSGTLKNAWDLNNANFKEAKEAVDAASKKFENIMDDALKLAGKMNEFVSSKS